MSPGPLVPPVMIHASIRDGSLRQAAAKRNIPTLVYEAGEALRFDEAAIQHGVDGIYRVMAYLGMYASSALSHPLDTLEARETRWVRASRGGIWHRSANLGDVVKHRQPLGFITDTFGDKPVQVRSPMDGLVIGHGQKSSGQPGGCPCSCGWGSGPFCRRCGQC